MLTFSPGTGTAGQALLRKPWLQHLSALTTFLLFLHFGNDATQPSFAQPVGVPSSLEELLATAYTYIAGHTTWPEPYERFTFCVKRDHELFEEFAKLLPTRKIGGRSIVIRSFETTDTETQRRCQVIALSKDIETNMTVIANVRGFPVLTISHEVDMTPYGGIVFLAHDKKLVPPKINFQALELSALQINSAILNSSRRHWREE